MALFKSEKLAYSQIVLQYQGRYYAVISAALGFSLRNPAELLTEQDLLALWNATMGEFPLDEGYIKPKAEVMLIGTAPAPPKQDHYQITLQMAEIDKSLLVFAPRKWSPAPLGQFIIQWENLAPKPVAFTWQNAYGGEEFIMNPAGTGFTAATSLPPFEVPSPGIKLPTGQNIIPAGFSPINMLDPRRWQYFKENREYWQKQGLPILPDHFDFQFFQQAPVDQQRTTPFEKAEPYHLQIGKQTFTGTLPDMHIRLFLANKKFAKGVGNPVEQPLRTDTLYLLPDQQKGIIIARTCFEVTNIHMNEWEHTLLILEKPDEPYSSDECKAIFNDYLNEAALLKPFDIKLAPDTQTPEPLKQKAKADKIFNKMQQWTSGIKPSAITDKPIRIRVNETALLKAKNLNFTDCDFKNFEIFDKDFIGEHFQNCTFKATHFIENTFKDCIFTDCQFENVSFYQTRLDNCEFINCQMSNTDFRNSQIDHCRIIASNMAAMQCDNLKITHSHWIENHFINSSAQNSMWQNMQLKGGSWKNINLHCAQFDSLRAQDLQIRDSSFIQTTGKHIMMNGPKMAFIRANFSNAKWEAPNFMESYWYRAIFTDAEMKQAEWSAAKIIRSYFTSSVFAESCFADTVFLATIIQTSNFKNALLAGATFKHSLIKNDNQLENVDFKHVIGLD